MREHYRWWAPRRRLEDTVALACAEGAQAVLEVGCGDGILLAAVAAGLAASGRSPSRVVGVDVALGRLRRAQQRAPCVLSCATAEALPLSPSTFDLVICAEVLEHLADPDAALRELRRVIRPGGRLILSVPVVGWSRWLEARLTGRVRFLDEQEHVREYCVRPLPRCETVAAFLGRVEAGGFGIEDERGVYGWPHRGERLWNAVLGSGPLVVPARALDRLAGRTLLRRWGRWLLLQARAR